MREIKFRGQRVDTKEWVYGSLIINNLINSYVIVNYKKEDDGEVSQHFFDVIPESVGQYTELKDKKGKEIYGGDIVDKGYCMDKAYIVRVKELASYLTRPIGISDDEFKKEYVDTYEECIPFICDVRIKKMKVIGNIYENKGVKFGLNKEVKDGK